MKTYTMPEKCILYAYMYIIYNILYVQNVGMNVLSNFPYISERYIIITSVKKLLQVLTNYYYKC
jgi:hypothetical protein